MRFEITLLAILTLSTAHAASPKLCIDKIGKGFEPIDLQVKVPPLYKKAVKSEVFYIQKGKYIYNEKEVSKKPGESYCKVEYHPNAFKPYEGFWRKNTLHPSRMHIMPGDQEEPTRVSISPQPNAKWLPVLYDCPNITTYEQLHLELKPVIDAPCTDWGDLLPKPSPKCEK